jgi:2-hydroxy-3-oxopropionate reductase
MSGAPVVGVAGLGVMGRPMAANLLAAGFPVLVWNRSPGRDAELVAAGAEAVGSPAELGARCAVVVTCVSDDAAVEAVVGEIAGAAGRGTVIADTSTIAPGSARAIQAALATRGVGFVDAPVSGGEGGARAATLAIMAGGEDAHVEAARPVLEALGRQVVHVGGPGAGQIAKAANQVIVGLTIQAVAEALSLAARAGADPARVREAIRGGFAESAVLETHGARMLAGDFAPGGRLALHLKDLRIALGLTEAVGEAPATAALAAVMERLAAAGEADADQAVLARAYDWPGRPAA